MKKLSSLIYWSVATTFAVALTDYIAITSKINRIASMVTNNLSYPQLAAEYHKIVVSDGLFIFLTWFITFAGLLIGTLEYRKKQLGGYMNFREGYKTGILFTLMFAVSYTFIRAFLQIRFSDEFSKILDNNFPIEDWNSIGSNSGHSLGYNVINDPDLNSVNVVIVIFAKCILGAILSLITARIAMKKNAEAPGVPV
jgi:hypothetical protein